MAASCKDVYRYTAEKISQLKRNNYTRAGRAKLAEIRHGMGKTPGELPSTWGILFEGMPEEMYAKAGSPTREEWAVYIALTLYALHQQGNDPVEKPMNQKNMRLGFAVARLCNNTYSQYTVDVKERIEHHFMALATADCMLELSRHLGYMVQLLKSNGIALDYPALAVDIYRYQFEDSVNEVRLTWGQDFYRYSRTREGNDNEE